MTRENPFTHATIPMRTIGPIKITGPVVQEEIFVPLATFETPLWPSVNRGASISRLTGGITSLIIKDHMTRSILVEGPDTSSVSEVMSTLEFHRRELEAVVSATSGFAQLQGWHMQIVGNLLYLRFEMNTGEAAGHNMVTKASDALLQWILARYPKLRYVSVSGNFCTDKKVSAVNGLLGRGKYVVSEITIPHEICVLYLKTTPQKIVNLNIKKNLLGSILSGSVGSANAHFANMLLAFYLATGQDAANIVEGSQGITQAEEKEHGLYFSVTLPNVIVGTIGNGKGLPFVQENLKMMGCLNSPSLEGQNAKRLAAILGATVLCGELSLLAAQTNQGELMKSHLLLERSSLHLKV